ncbi:MAG: dTDP-4-dehydrorhamnose 3,5-epimerase [Bacteroidetes bacterium]|nr:dTDP-4-dehydrorhamnose 3,5-epimerase [Bacteroidota bacterium]
MEVTHYHIEGLLSYVPRIFADDRGAFSETFNQQAFNAAVGQTITFVQDNQSISKLNVLRGLHFQVPPFAQGKLVRVLKGRVLDVAVDLRKNSATYGQHVAVELSGSNNCVFWIPEGFAHGFAALEEGSVFAYKCTAFYSRESERCIRWNDPDLAIDWGVLNPLLSEKDAEGTFFKSFNSPF